jgi:signal peptidase I
LIIFFILLPVYSHASLQKKSAQCVELIKEVWMSFPGGSMNPLIPIGGYIKINEYLINTCKILKRGKIYSFSSPQDPNILYAKRLIGLPGDHIQFRNGRLFINNNEKYSEFLENTMFRGMEFELHKENVDGHTYKIMRDVERKKEMDEQNFNETIPDGQYYFLGDNRDHSKDSRFLGVGLIPFANIHGVVVEIRNEL